MEKCGTKRHHFYNEYKDRKILDFPPELFEISPTSILHSARWCYVGAVGEGRGGESIIALSQMSNPETMIPNLQDMLMGAAVAQFV